MKAFRFSVILLFLFLGSLPEFSSGKTAEVKKAADSLMTPDLKTMKEKGPIDIEADRLTYDKEEQVYQAHGNVEMVRGDFSLRAEHARLNPVTNDMVAWGNVVLKEGEDVLECERLEVNMNTQAGKIYQGKLFLKDQNFHITGREAEKLGESRYRIREGSFTTCDASRPPWKFTVRELDVTMGGTGVAKGPVFYIEDIPVFYFPVMPVPVKRERQTGLLLPTVGYSNKNGAEVKTAFYWAISKDMDSTLFLDYLGDRGFKEGLEYRYAFPHGTTGQATYYFIDDKVFDGKRQAFFLQHQQKLPYNFYLKGDINEVSDRFYPRDFEDDLPERTKIDARSLNQLRSILFGGKNWDQFSFIVDGERFNNLTTDDNDPTLQKYPQASFYAHPQSLFKTPLFFDLTLSYVNFWRNEGIRAQRGDFLPQISYPFRLFNLLKVTPEVGFRETFYHIYQDPIEERNGSKSRETYGAGIEMSTELYRVYETSLTSKLSGLFDVTRWMHTIEPTVSYNYNPRVSQSDLPAFDAIDRIPYRNEIIYGFTQRLLGKTGKDRVGLGPYEYLRLKVSQGYSLGDPYDLDEKGTGRYFSNIRGELWMNFNPYLSFRGEAELNPYQWNLNILDGLMKIKDFRDDTLQVEYRFTKDKIQQLNLYTKIKTIDPLYVFGSVRYNLLDKWRVESDYGALFQTQCWTLGILVEDINQSPDGTQKKELKVQAFVTLLGIGSLGHRPRAMSL
ncbi:MAG TPA: LPS assembly protein LptD [Thermodesulfobacteriota bacterium]|nr:LPS assembly protein LptD [Thermodesulfobacteriota bacterium]